MARAPINALVFPYRKKGDGYEFAIFNRSDCEEDFWQGISGGAEDDETPMEAAKRESWEEGRIDPDSPFTQLDSICSLPASNFRGTGWGDDVYVVHEYAFGVRVENQEIELSDEHKEYRWLSLDEAITTVKFQSNRHALGELSLRIERKDL